MLMEICTMTLHTLHAGYGEIVVERLVHRYAQSDNRPQVRERVGPARHCDRYTRVYRKRRFQPVTNLA